MERMKRCRAKVREGAKAVRRLMESLVKKWIGNCRSVDGRRPALVERKYTRKDPALASRVHGGSPKTFADRHDKKRRVHQRFSTVDGTRDDWMTTVYIRCTTADARDRNNS